MADRVTELEAQLADVMGEGGSYHRLQVELDKQLQLHKDKDAEHGEAMSKLKADHTAQLAEAAKQYEGNVALLMSKHAEEVKRVQEGAAALLAEAKKQLEEHHASHVAKLKNDVLVPAMRDLQARQAADLAARQQAELAALMQ